MVGRAPRGALVRPRGQAPYPVRDGTRAAADMHPAAAAAPPLTGGEDPPRLPGEKTLRIQTKHNIHSFPHSSPRECPIFNH